MRNHSMDVRRHRPRRSAAALLAVLALLCFATVAGKVRGPGVGAPTMGGPGAYSTWAE